MRIFMLIASVKMLEHEGTISPSSFYGQLPDYYSHVFCLVYQVDEFSFYYSHVFYLVYQVDEFSFKEMRTWGQF